MSIRLASPGYVASLRRSLSLALPRSTLSQLVAGRNPYAARGNAARDQRRYAVAAAFYEAALHHDPRNAALHIQCGHMHKEAGDFEAAGRHYAQARRLTPDDADLWLQLGHFHKVQDHLQDAAAAYRQAIALSPDWDEPQQELTHVTERLAAARTAPVHQATVLPVPGAP